MRNSPFFWLIFYRIHNGGAWRAYRGGRGGLEVIAYPTNKDAASDLYSARQTYGKGNARLYKFRPEHFIFGGHK